MKPCYLDSGGLWVRDGSLRDIHVHDTEDGHWDRFDQLVGRYDHAYTFDGIPLPFPGSRTVLQNRDGSHLLSILLGGPVVNCHYFVAWQLELDICPKEVNGPLEHEQVLSFIEKLAGALELPVAITPENWEDNPFLTYTPETGSWLVHKNAEQGSTMPVRSKEGR